MLPNERSGRHGLALLIWLAAAVCLFATAPAGSLYAQAKSVPPVLEVETSPGDVKVFVDGVLMGRTNREGRLRLAKLGRGLHTVRLSHEGYKDFKHDIQLEAGQIVPLRVELERLQPGAPASEPTPSDETSPEGSATTIVGLGSGTVGAGVLRGLSVHELTPARRQALRLTPGTQGVVISEVKADSPCGAAGLQKNDVINQINRRPVYSPHEFVRFASDAGGEVVLRIHRHGKTQLVAVSESE